MDKRNAGMLPEWLLVPGQIPKKCGTLLMEHILIDSTNSGSKYLREIGDAHHSLSPCWSTQVTEDHSGFEQPAKMFTNLFILADWQEVEGA